jgi:hypothetical protein
MKEFEPSNYFDTLDARAQALFISVAEEARGLVDLVKGDGELRYLRSSSGLLRLAKNQETGEVYITGATKTDNQDLQEMQNYVAQQLGIKIF